MILVADVEFSILHGLEDSRVGIAASCKIASQVPCAALSTSRSSCSSWLLCRGAVSVVVVAAAAAAAAAAEVGMLAMFAVD